MEGAGKGTISDRGEEFGNCLAAVLTAHSAAGWGEAAEEITCLPCAQPESHRASVSHNLSSLFLSHSDSQHLGGDASLFLVYT